MLPQSLIDLLLSDNHDDRKLGLIITLQEYENPAKHIMAIVYTVKGMAPFVELYHYYFNSNDWSPPALEDLLKPPEDL